VKPAEVRRRAERMLGALRLEGRELSVLLCDDRTIQDLNRTYRRRDRPTDVLAFAMAEGEGPGDERLLGDIVISLETARRQAHAGQKAIVAEVTYLMAHGFLHLLGFDHRTDAEERRMNARADMLVAAASGRAAIGEKR
jgi:probable rRNA maturation factor